MGKTAVLVHGGCAGAWSVEGVAEVLRRHGWTCHTPNLPFHGTGPVADPDPTLGQTGIEDYTNEVAKLICTLDEIPVVIGHSLGGLVTQKLAARGLARAIVLLNSCAPWGILPATDSERAIAIELMSAGAFRTKPMQPNFDFEAAFALNSQPPEVQRSVFDRLGPESGRVLFELYFWMFDDSRATEVDSAKVTCPVLVVSGSEDKVISRQTALRIAERYGSQATFRGAPGHGHFIFFEPGWEKVAEDCAAWLEQAAGARAMLSR